jgi:hypothetical protein
MPGARKALEKFHRSGLPLAAVCNTSFGEEVIRYELDKHGLADHLMFVSLSWEKHLSQAPRHVSDFSPAVRVCQRCTSAQRSRNSILKTCRSGPTRQEDRFESSRARHCQTGGSAPAVPPTRSLAGTPAPRAARVAHSLSLVRAGAPRCRANLRPSAVERRRPSAWEWGRRRMQPEECPAVNAWFRYHGSHDDLPVRHPLRGEPRQRSGG